MHSFKNDFVIDQAYHTSLSPKRGRIKRKDSNFVLSLNLFFQSNFGHSGIFVCGRFDFCLLEILAYRWNLTRFKRGQPNWR